MAAMVIVDSTDKQEEEEVCVCMRARFCLGYNSSPVKPRSLNFLENFIYNLDGHF